MASTFSTNLNLELMADGEKVGSWGSITNANWEIVDAAIGAIYTGGTTLDSVLVSGTLEAGGPLLITGAGASIAGETFIQGPLRIGTYVSVSGTLIGSNLQISGQASVSGLTVADGLGCAVLNVSGTSSLAGNINLHGTASFANTVFFGGGSVQVNNGVPVRIVSHVTVSSMTITGDVTVSGGIRGLTAGIIAGTVNNIIFGTTAGQNLSILNNAPTSVSSGGGAIAIGGLSGGGNHGGLAIVKGIGTVATKNFTDIVMYNGGSATAITGLATSNVGTRTYTVASNSLALTYGSATAMTVKAFLIRDRIS